MRPITNLAYTGIAAFALSMATPSSATTTFSFQFDSAGIFVPDGPLEPPIVGTGTFISPVDLAVGTYDLASLPGFQLAFSFVDGDTYSTSDMTTPLSGVSVMVTDLGGGVQRLFFVESGGPGSDAGPHGGVLDLDSGGNFLSFAPSFFGNYLYQETGSGGRYAALSEGVPEPSTWALMMFGMVAIGIGLRQRRKHAPAAEN